MGASSHGSISLMNIKDKNVNKGRGYTTQEDPNISYWYNPISVGACNCILGISQYEDFFSDKVFLSVSSCLAWSSACRSGFLAKARPPRVRWSIPHSQLSRGNLTSLAEILRESQRALRRAIRELERERMNLQRQEKNLTIEIKQMAKKGQMVRLFIFWGVDSCGVTPHLFLLFGSQRPRSWHEILFVRALRLPSSISSSPISRRSAYACRFPSPSPNPKAFLTHVRMHATAMTLPDTAIAASHGRCDEGSDKGDVGDEQAHEHSRNAENPSELWDTVRDDGHEGGNDGRNHGRHVQRGGRRGGERRSGQSGP